MSKPYQLIVFDWEGTLGDTLGPILHCIADEAKRLNFGDFDENFARQCVDLGLIKALKKVFPDLSLQQHEILLNEIQNALLSRHGEVYLLAGAQSLISRIHAEHISLAIASNKGQQSLQRALQLTGLDDYFKIVRCAGKLAPKPSTEMLEEILDVFQMKPQQTLMIGDSPSDMEMAVQLGVDAIGLDFYHINSSTLKAAGALAVFHSYDEVADYLELPKVDNPL